jgi:hypothetical protein
MGAQSRPQQGNGVLMFLNFVNAQGESVVLISIDQVASIQPSAPGVLLRMADGTSHQVASSSYQAVKDALSRLSRLLPVCQTPELVIVKSEPQDECQAG